MTQADVAQALSCSQSAISRVESGQLHALSTDKLTQLAGLVGEAFDPAELAASAPGAGEQTSFRYCASPWCPSCVPYRVRDRLCLLPTLSGGAGGPDAGEYCDLCGEPLRDGCPSCSAPVQGRAFCVRCGEALVPADPDVVADIMRCHNGSVAGRAALREEALASLRWVETVRRGPHIGLQSDGDGGNDTAGSRN